MKKIGTSFLCIFLFVFILFISPGMAVNTPLKKDSLQTVFSVSTAKKIGNKKSNRRLKWKKKVLRKIAKKKLKKAKNPKNKLLPIIALLSSTIGIFIPFVGSIAGIILGLLSLARIEEDPEKYGGKGMAIIAIVLGGLYLALLINYLYIA